MQRDHHAIFVETNVDKTSQLSQVVENIRTMELQFEALYERTPGSVPRRGTIQSSRRYSGRSQEEIRRPKRKKPKKLLRWTTMGQMKSGTSDQL
jgi:hypothetical protein